MQVVLKSLTSLAKKGAKCKQTPAKLYLITMRRGAPSPDFCRVSTSARKMY